MPSEPFPDASAALRARRLVAFAAIVVAIALCFSNGHLDPFSLTAMTLAGAAGLGAALLGRRPSVSGSPSRLESWIPRVPAKLLWSGIMVSIAIDFFLPPGYYADGARLRLFRPLVAVAGLLALTYQWRRQPGLLIRARFPLFLLLAAAMSAMVIWASPQPTIDVWVFRQLGAAGLTRGQNPYALQYPNIYGGPQYYAKAALTADGTGVLWNPYPPLTMLLDLPSVILMHEVRWTMVGCTLIAAWAIRRLGRGTLAGELAAVLLLMQPRAFFVIEQSWTEPTVLASLALTLLAAASWSDREATPAVGGCHPRGAWIATGLAGALLAASKQYSPLFLVPLFLALPARGRWKAAALAIGGAVALMLPFFLSSPRGFFDGVVVFQFLAPFRADALSWLAALAWLGGPGLPPWPAFVLAAVALALTLGRRVTLAQAATAAAAAFMVLLLLNKQAFCNYYWLAGGLFCVATALHARRLPFAEAEAESVLLLPSAGERVLQRGTTSARPERGSAEL